MARRPARVEDVHVIAASMPHVTVDGGSRDNAVYQIGGKSFVFFRNPRPDAVDPVTGERYDDVIVIWVESDDDKRALVQDTASPFFTTAHFDGHLSVLVRASRLAELDVSELRELIQDAWLSRASRRRGASWLAARPLARPRSALSNRPDPVVCSVQNEVRGRAALDEREAASIARVLAELERLADPFSETADPVHVTGSAMIVGPRGVVLLKHRRLGIWVQPGGHVDPGETPWAAAEREAIEETGLAITPAGGAERPPLVHVDVHDGGRGHTHLDLRYLFDGGDADPAPPAHESQEVHWFAWPDAVGRAEPTMAALLRHLAPPDDSVPR